jgi:hypothetical protein
VGVAVVLSRNNLLSGRPLCRSGRGKELLFVSAEFFGQPLSFLLFSGRVLPSGIVFLQSLLFDGLLTLLLLGSVEQVIIPVQNFARKSREAGLSAPS